MNSKKYVVSVIIGFVALLLLLGAVTVIVDPYFHYHGPVAGLSYRFDDQRYINDGILKHFDYDAIIAGTSMTENFRSSQLDELFGVNSVKTPFSGGYYKEINDRLTGALLFHPNTKMIVRGLDTSLLLLDKDDTRYDSYPEYLYDDFLINDVEYLFNKDVFFNQSVYTLQYTLSGNQTTDFDSYSNSRTRNQFGKDIVLSKYDRLAPKESDEKVFDSETKKLMVDNLGQNVISLIEKYPATQFYYFLPPYSVVWFDERNQNGELTYILDAMRAEIEILAAYDNIHLFGFFDDFDLISDLDNYTDRIHYGDWVNSQILQSMKDGKHQLTLDNYEDYCDKVEEFLLNYDYDSLFDVTAQ